MSTLLKKTLLSSLLFPIAASGAVISGVGEQVLNPNENVRHTCSVAETRAIKSALEKYSGGEFNVQKKNYCYDVKNYAHCNYYNEKDYTVSGTVREILDRKEYIEGNKCKVEVKLLVEKSRYLNVDVSGKYIYIEGEPLQFVVNAKEELYLYVFNITRKKVDLIYPFNYIDDNLIDDKFVFPGNGKKYLTYLEKGVNQDEETILLLFTKHYVDFDKYTLNRQRLVEIVDSIPNHSKRIFTYNIFIKRK
jgi:hypothetical protein